MFEIKSFSFFCVSAIIRYLFTIYHKKENLMGKKSNPLALIPILVFLVLYLGLGILFEYVLKVPMGFYGIPIVVVFMVALLVACFQNPKLKFDEKLKLMGE